MPSDSFHKATATPSSLTSGANLCLLRIVHCYHTSSSAPSSTSAQFLSTFICTLTASWHSRPSRAGPCPRVRCRLALPHRPLRRESDPLHSHRSNIRARSCTMQTGESLPHSSIRMYAQTRLGSVSSAHLPFWVFRVLCICAEAASARLAPFAPSLFTFAEMRLLYSKRKSPSSSSCATHLVRAHLVYLVRLATKVDGDSEARGWGWDADAGGDGNADVAGVGFVCGLVPSRSSFAFARSRLVPTFAHTLAPTLILVPVRLPFPPLCGTERAGFELRWYAHTLAHSQKWRSAVVPVIPVLVRGRRNMRTAGVYACANGAHHTLILALARVIVRSRRWVCAYPRRRRRLLPTRIRRAHAPRIWVYLWIRMRTRVSLEVGTERCGSVRVYCSRPSLAFSRYLSLETRSDRNFLHDLIYARPIQYARPLNERSS
ncbi:hypothetical protein B0H13DRAFT_2360439 [Mycena leptocephala]|nr:hypothetical protein B0H13DRAFT_2360439 [Mycena leptocephala]